MVNGGFMAADRASRPEAVFLPRVAAPFGPAPDPKPYWIHKVAGVFQVRSRVGAGPPGVDSGTSASLTTH